MSFSYEVFWNRDQQRNVFMSVLSLLTSWEQRV